MQCSKEKAQIENTKQQIKLTDVATNLGHLDIQTGCLGDSVWGTESHSAQQVWCVGIQ